MCLPFGRRVCSAERVRVTGRAFYLAMCVVLSGLTVRRGRSAERAQVRTPMVFAGVCCAYHLAGARAVLS